MREWRLQHPKATLREIETELDARLGRMRARMLEDLASSVAADWQDAPPTEQPSCPDCGRRSSRAGSQPRTLQTHGGQDLILERSYGVARPVGPGFSPLDEELGCCLVA